jgi:hypothetical protein
MNRVRPSHHDAAGEAAAHAMRRPLPLLHLQATESSRNPILQPPLRTNSTRSKHPQQQFLQQAAASKSWRRWLWREQLMPHLNTQALQQPPPPLLLLLLPPPPQAGHQQHT